MNSRIINPKATDTPYNRIYTSTKTRLLEIIPGFTTWMIILSPVILSIFFPTLIAIYIISYSIYWFLKSMRISVYLIQGYRRLTARSLTNWRLEYETANEMSDLNSKGIYHSVILATYNEDIRILQKSIQALVDSKYDSKRIILVLAYELRIGKKQANAQAKKLEKEFSSHFKSFILSAHPDNIPGELPGKGSNISLAGQKLMEYTKKNKLKAENIIVTTLDADHRVSFNFFDDLTVAYLKDKQRDIHSYQPIPLFFNNIWDVPAPGRIVAVTSSIWVLIESMRPHRLRNFAAHSQGLQALIDCDFWSITTPVEDGHQYWRCLFAYEGKHRVIPIYSVIYQDAVLDDSYRLTIKNQYLQLRRWAYGVSDFPYIIKNFVNNKTISLSEKITYLFRLLEGYISWATAPITLMFVAWLPLYLGINSEEQVLVHQLPIITSRVLSAAMVGLVITIWISTIMLPSRPAKYSRIKSLGMLTQWIIFPIVFMCISSFAAIDAQTRLMLGKYLGFRVTNKSYRE